MPTRRLLVMHFTNGASALSTINNHWRTPAAKGACAHIVIDRNGDIYQCRPFNRTAGHAGVSRWKDPNTGKLYRGLNSCSIGIELANAGEEEALAEQWSTIPLLTAKHRNEKKPRQWEQYPQSQIASALVVAKALLVRYNLDDITGHDCIAPERKIDPGPAFPMQSFREALGFSGLPVVYRP